MAKGTEEGEGRMKALTALVIASVLSAGAYVGSFSQATEIISYQKEVEKGDTLWDICSKIATNEEDVRFLVWQAKRDNNITDSGNLQPGTVIVVNVERTRNHGN